jgi:hypothetical protein
LDKKVVLNQIRGYSTGGNYAHLLNKSKRKEKRACLLRKFFDGA